MQLRICRLDLTWICFTEVDDNIAKQIQKVPKQELNEGFVDVESRLEML